MANAPTTPAQVADNHQAAGHEVMVISGIVRCLTCDLVIDASGHRPGLIAANQTR